MKHNAKLNDPKKDFARVNVTFLSVAEESGSRSVKRSDSVYLTTAEGEKLLKDLNK